MSAAAAATKSKVNSKASSCESCLPSWHPRPRSGRYHPLLVCGKMASFHACVALIGPNLVLTTAAD